MLLTLFLTGGRGFRVYICGEIIINIHVSYHDSGEYRCSITVPLSGSSLKTPGPRGLSQAGVLGCSGVRTLAASNFQTYFHAPSFPFLCRDSERLQRLSIPLCHVTHGITSTTHPRSSARTRSPAKIGVCCFSATGFVS